jgi:hypothetical protein
VKEVSQFVSREAARFAYEGEDRCGVGLGGEEGSEGEAGGLDMDDKAEARMAVGWACEEEVRDRFRGRAVGAEGGGRNFEAVEVGVEAEADLTLYVTLHNCLYKGAGSY